MKISRKRLKRLVQKPRVRPRIVKSLTQFDDNINSEQNAKLDARTEVSDTIGVLRCLVKNMNSNYQFKLTKKRLIKKFLFSQKSLNFNLAALHQLKIITVNWRNYKSTPDVVGVVNQKNVF